MKFTIKQDDLKTEFTRFRDLPNGALFTDGKKQGVWQKGSEILNAIPIAGKISANHISPSELVLPLEVCNTVAFKVREVR